MAKMLTVEQIQKGVHKIAPNYDIKRVSLFGSFASGNPTENSDVDLLVTFFDKPKKPITLFTIAGIMEDMENITQRRVDVIEYPLPQGSLLEINKEVLLYAV